MFDELWSEIQDAPGEIFDFDGWIEAASSDPEFISQCEKNNAEFDNEAENEEPGWDLFGFNEAN